MTKTKILALVAATAATLAAAGPAAAQRWDRGFDHDYRLVGRGVPLLLPELRDSPRGHAFVMRNFDRNRDGIVQPFEARAANRAFLEIAGPDPRRFDWGAPPPPPPPAVVEVAPAGPVRWDRGAMRGYHMRQTRYGATFTISDVLFQTDSAALRPEAIAKLRPLADYLRANPGVDLRIDGYTDSRASASYNQSLSEHRAESVESALAGMGVGERRLHADGHGESDPVATNATPDGRRLNRRVEVTLLGQRADRF